MSVRTALVVAGMLSLGGCGSGGGSDTSGQIRAGQWEMRSEVKSISGPGVPAGAADMMKAQATTVTTCISEEQARTSNADIFTGKQNPNCTAEGFKASGGKIDGTLTCKAQNGQPGMAMTMAGTFAAENYDIDIKMKMSGPQEGMTIETKTLGRRIGDCPATPKA
jgi:hypothetical protein